MAMPPGHQGDQAWTPVQNYSTPVQPMSSPYRAPTAIPWVPTQGVNMVGTPPQGPAAQLAIQQPTTAGIPWMPPRGVNMMGTPPQDPAAQPATRQFAPVAQMFTPQNPSHLNRTWSMGSASSQESTGGLSVVTNDSEGFPTVRSHSSKSLKERQEWREQRERQRQLTPTNAQMHAPQPFAPPPEAPGNVAPDSTVPPGYLAEDRGQAHLYDRPLEQVPSQYPPVHLGPNGQVWQQPGPPPGMAPEPHPQAHPPLVPQGPFQIPGYAPFGQGPPADCPHPGYGPPAPPVPGPITPPLHHYDPPLAPVPQPPNPMLNPPTASTLDIPVPADINPRYYSNQVPRGPRGHRGRGKHSRNRSSLDPSAKAWGPSQKH